MPLIDELVEWLFTGGHSPDWWMVVLTVLLAAGAGLTAWYAKGQLDTTREASLAALKVADQTRRDAARPLVFFRKAALLANPGFPNERFIEVKLENVGLGAAMEVEAPAWVAPVPPEVLADRAGKVQPFIRGLEATLLSKPPTGRADLLAIAAGAEEISYVLQDMRAAVDIGGADWAVVFVSLRYKDLFGESHQYPAVEHEHRHAPVWRMAQLEDRLPVQP